MKIKLKCHPSLSYLVRPNLLPIKLPYCEKYNKQCCCFLHLVTDVKTTVQSVDQKTANAKIIENALFYYAIVHLPG